MVPISITGRGEKITAAQQEHAEEKIQKLERYFSGINRIEVVLEKGAERSFVELVISIKKGAPIVVHHEETDLYAAIDLVLDKAETQLTRHKEKVQDRRTPKLSESYEGPEEVKEELETYQEIVEKQDFE